MLPLRRTLCFAFIPLFFVTLSPSQSYAQMFSFPSIPLANRSPYLNAWYTSPNSSQPLTQSWPGFWNKLVRSLYHVITSRCLNFVFTQSFLGWAGKIRVDNITYQWLGADLKPPFTGNITNIQVTPTRSIFTMKTGPMNVTVTFLSPIEVRGLANSFLRYFS